MSVKIALNVIRTHIVSDRFLGVVFWLPVDGGEAGHVILGLRPVVGGRVDLHDVDLLVLELLEQID